MKIKEISNIYSALPQCGAFLKALSDKSMRHIFLKGMYASSASVFFAAVVSGSEKVKGKSEKLKEGSEKVKGKSEKLKGKSEKSISLTAVFVLQDNDEAGYFYHDLTQILGTDNVLFYPSSYRRAVKYGQRDAANEILRTETLSRLAAQSDSYMYVVTCPEALSELVVSKRRLDERTINIGVGDIVNLADLGRKLREFGFAEVDYVYEPGQFAMRGSIVDVYSYSSELPFRIDFFGSGLFDFT